jgi:hypothetical protein
MYKKLGDIAVFRNGTVTLHKAKYQLAPAVTKNAPDKNLHASFQNPILRIAIDLHFL